jgi:hypothetical protein
MEKCISHVARIGTSGAIGLIALAGNTSNNNTPYGSKEPTCIGTKYSDVSYDSGADGYWIKLAPELEGSFTYPKEVASEFKTWFGNDKPSGTEGEGGSTTNFFAFLSKSDINPSIHGGGRLILMDLHKYNNHQFTEATGWRSIEVKCPPISLANLGKIAKEELRHKHTH